MASKVQVTLDNPYWVGDDIYTKVDREPYLVDSGAEVYMTRRSLETKGHFEIMVANVTTDKMPFEIWKGIVWLKGPYNLISTRDLKELYAPKRCRKSLRQRLNILQSRVKQLHTPTEDSKAEGWYKAVDHRTDHRTEAKRK